MPSWRVETITPDIAKGYLESNKKTQRKLKPRHVKFLSKAMLEGSWVFNGDPVRFDEQGNLIDGQHRMHAIIESGLSFQFFVVRGLESKSMLTIDTGRRARCPGDFLYMAGEKNATRLGAALNVIIHIERNVFGNFNAFSMQDISDCLERHPQVRESIWVSNSMIVRKLLKPCNAVALHYLFARINEYLADAFFNTINTGETLKQGIDAALVLRNNLEKRKLDESRKNTAWHRTKHRYYETVITIKAWNAYIKGVVPKRYSHDPKKEKSFPVIGDKVYIDYIGQ